MKPLLRLEPIDLRHEAAYRASDTHVPDFDAWFGYRPEHDFGQWVRFHQKLAAGKLPVGRLVPATFMLALVDGRVVGRVSIRHVLNEELRDFGGNIGYCVVPAARRRGYATEMLRQALAYCRDALHLDRALVTCDETNLASRRVIEKNGGQLEDVRDAAEGGPRRMRWWIDLRGEPQV